MSFILPNKKAQQLADEQRMKGEMSYQKEMFKKLRDWGIENDCAVESRIFPINTPSMAGNSTMLYFKKMTLEEKNDLIRKINEGESLKKD